MKRLIFQAKNAIVFGKPHEYWFFETALMRWRSGEPNAGELNDHPAFSAIAKPREFSLDFRSPREGSRRWCDPKPCGHVLSFLSDKIVSVESSDHSLLSNPFRNKTRAGIIAGILSQNFKPGFKEDHNRAISCLS
jgi:hypothetical protein